MSGHDSRVRPLYLAVALGLLTSCASTPPPLVANLGDDDDDDDDDDATPEPESCDTWAQPKPIAPVDDDGILEISGLALSRVHDDMLWVHEDSGRPAVLTALGSDGRTRGTLTLTNTTNVDWEDLAIGPCGEESCLFIGEFGDNGESRDDAAILRVVEPTFDSEPFALSVEPTVFPFAYEDGARDAEALVVGPDGMPVVIDKLSDGTASLHRFEALTEGEQAVLDEIATIETGIDSSGGLPAMATAADLNALGDRLLVRTYGWLWEFDLDGKGLEDAEDAARSELTHGPELQGEAAAYAPDGRAVWHVAEGGHAMLFRLRCAD